MMCVSAFKRIVILDHAFRQFWTMQIALKYLQSVIALKAGLKMLTFRKEARNGQIQLFLQLYAQMVGFK